MDMHKAVLRRLATPRPDPRASELADMADSLDAMAEAGAFALCFAHVREDMASLAAKLRQLGA